MMISFSMHTGYVKLSDSILYRIEQSDEPELEEVSPERERDEILVRHKFPYRRSSTHPTDASVLPKARKIIRRIRRRDLYKLVDEALLPTNVDPKLRRVLPEDILAYQTPKKRQKRRNGISHPDDSDSEEEEEYLLSPHDLRIHNLALNYAMQDKNPVQSPFTVISTHFLSICHLGDSLPVLVTPSILSFLPSFFLACFLSAGVRFFTHWNSADSVLIPEDKVSFMLPKNFQERSMPLTPNLLHQSGRMCSWAQIWLSDALF